MGVANYSQFTKVLLVVAFLALVGFSVFGFKTDTDVENAKKAENNSINSASDTSNEEKQINNTHYKNIKEQLSEDKNSNNIPDWQEELEAALKVSEKNNIDNNKNIDTLNEKVAQALINQYLDIKQTNPNTNKDELKKISEKVFNEIKQEELSKLPQYYLKDIKVFEPQNKTQILMYKKTFRKAINDLSYIDENELVLIARYIDTKDKNLLSKIHKFGLYYETAYKNLLRVPAPEEIKLAHLDIINSFAAMHYVLSNFPDYEQDPAKAYVLIAIFNAHERVLQSASSAMQAFFEKNGVQ